MNKSKCKGCIFSKQVYVDSFGGCKENSFKRDLIDGDNCEYRTSELADKYIETLWSKFEDITLNEEDGVEIINSAWFIFSEGTEKEDIWHWFDNNHSKGIAWLLYESNSEI